MSTPPAPAPLTAVPDATGSVRAEAPEIRMELGVRELE